MENTKTRSLLSERESPTSAHTPPFRTSLILTDIGGIPELLPTRLEHPSWKHITNVSPLETAPGERGAGEAAEGPPGDTPEPHVREVHRHPDGAQVRSHVTEEFMTHAIPDPDEYDEDDYEIVVVGEGDAQEITIPDVRHRAPPTFAEAVASGSVAAVCETLSLHWTTATRFREQLKAPRTSSLRVLYNSLLPDLISMVPITIAQVFFDSLLRKAMGTHDLSTAQLMFAAAGAGFIASPFPSYAEMIMLMQQKYSISFRKAIHFHYSQLGWKGILRGLPVCSIRDSVYTTAYLGFAPWLNETCRNRFSEYPSLAKFNHWLPFVIAGPTGGLAAGIVTQPLDCIKSRQQASLDRKSVIDASREIFREDGYKGFFTGMKGRLQRVSFGVIVLSFINDKMQRWLRY